MQRMISWLSWFLACAACIGFFLPWLKDHHAKKNAPAPTRTVQELARDADLPWHQLAFGIQQDEYQRALDHPWEGASGWMLWKSLRPGSSETPRHAEQANFIIGHHSRLVQGYWLYAIPEAALLAAAFLTLWPSGKISLVLSMFACSGVYTFVRVHMHESYFDRLVSSTDLGLGFWISLYALLALAAITILIFLLRLIRG